MAITHSTRHATPVLGRASQSFLQALDRLVETRQRRKVRRTYGDMSDAQLRDIGLTRWELEVALSQPLEKSAADALARAAATEAARW